MPGLINYVKKVFKNYPDTTTKISAENLNHLDNGIFNLDQAAGELAADLNNFSFRNNSGTAQYSMNGGSTWTNFKNPTGTRSITANGTYDVTDYASASVNVSSSASKSSQSPANGNSAYYTNGKDGQSSFGHCSVITGNASVSQNGKTVTISIPETVRVYERTTTSLYKDSARSITITLNLS